MAQCIWNTKLETQDHIRSRSDFNVDDKNSKCVKRGLKPMII